MSAIPVTMEIILGKDSALAALNEFTQQVQATVNEISASQIVIPLKVDDEASWRAEEILKAIPRDPVEIPITIDSASVEAQMAEVKSMVASQPPIQIPIQLVPGGGGAGGGAAAGEDNGDDLGGGGGLAGLMSGRGMFQLFRQLMMIRAGFDVAKAGGEAAEGWYDYARPAGNERDFEQYGHDSENARNDALKSVRNVPIVGGVLADSADALDRGESALINLFRGRGFESNAGYTERMEADSKAIEEHTKKVHEESEARAHLVDTFKRQGERDDLTVENSGVHGSFDRTINNLEAQRSSILEDYTYTGPQAANAKFFDAKGNLLPEAAAARDKSLAAVDAREKSATDDLQHRLKFAGMEGDILQDELTGDSAKEHRDTFALRMAKEREAAYSRSHDEGVYFDNVTGPIEQQISNRDEQHRATAIADEDRYIKATGQSRTDEYRAEMNHDPMAEAQAKNEAIDANVRKLQEAAAIEIDLEKQKQLGIEATAAKRAGDTEQAKNIADANRELYDRSVSATETSDRAHGMGYSAQKLEIERRFNDHEISPDQRKAELDSIEQSRQREFRGIGERTMEYVLQSKNHPRMAELSRIEFDISEQLRDHSDDPQMQRELRQEGAAQLTAFAHPNQQSQWYSSAADYAKALNTGYLNQDQQASKEALEAAKELKEGVKEWRHIMEGSQNVQVIRNGY